MGEFMKLSTSFVKKLLRISGLFIAMPTQPTWQLPSWMKLVDYLNDQQK